jgi:SulP family sulfate permease
MSFIKIVQLAREHHFELVLTGIRPELQHRLQASGFRQSGSGVLSIFPDLDHGLEYCEDRLLETLEQAAPGTRQGIMQQIAGRMRDAAHQQRFLGYLEVLSVEAGQVLIEQGEASDGLLFVEDGVVSVYLETSNGERIRLRRTESGTIIGELGFYLQQPRTASVIADQQATVYRLSAEALLRMENREPELAMVFHRFMAEFSSMRLLFTTRTLEAVAD